jgi:LemA protein
LRLFYSITIMSSTIALIALALLILFWGVGAYKRLLRLKRQFRDVAAQLAAHLKRRHALVAALLDDAGSGQDGFAAVITARKDAVDASVKAATGPTDKISAGKIASAEAALTASLRAAASQLPTHASGTTAPLVAELADAEKEIAFAWQLSNHAAAQYNEAVRQFPGSIVAVLFAFRPAPVLPVSEAAFAPATESEPH